MERLTQINKNSLNPNSKVWMPKSANVIQSNEKKESESQTSISENSVKTVPGRFRQRKNRKKKTSIPQEENGLSDTKINNELVSSVLPEKDEGKKKVSHSKSDKHSKRAASKREKIKKVATEEKDAIESCVVCADVLEFRAVGECNHNGVCGLCMMRLFVVLNKRECPICKLALEHLIVSPGNRSYESFETWGDLSLQGDSIFDESSGILFIECREYYNKIMSLRSFDCVEAHCNERLMNLNALENHLHSVHRKSFCKLCLKGRNLFIQEQTTFTKKELQSHESADNSLLRIGGWKGHPLCKFCKERFMESAMLYEHMEKEHYKCHLCQEETSQSRYYRDYNSLESHFRKLHYLCEDPQCLAAKFLVFGNLKELQLHSLDCHGVSLVQNFTLSRSSNPSSEIIVQTIEQPLETRNLETDFPPLPAASLPREVLNVIPNIRLSQPPRSAPTTNKPMTRSEAFADALEVNKLSKQMILSSDVVDSSLLEWGKANMGRLEKLERKISTMLNDPKATSLQLKAMPRYERRMMHELAALYGFISLAYDAEPYRYLSFIKQKLSCEPIPLLSTFIKKPINKSQTNKIIDQQTNAVPEVKKSEVPDSWSDNDDETEKAEKKLVIEPVHESWESEVMEVTADDPRDDLENSNEIEVVGPCAIADH